MKALHISFHKKSEHSQMKATTVELKVNKVLMSSLEPFQDSSNTPFLLPNFCSGNC